MQPPGVSFSSCLAGRRSTTVDVALKHALAPPALNALRRWIRLYNLVARNQGFLQSTGRAHHLDLYAIALGGCSWVAATPFGAPAGCCRGWTASCTDGTPVQILPVSCMASRRTSQLTCDVCASPPLTAPRAADCLPWCSRDGLHVVDTGVRLALRAWWGREPHTCDLVPQPTLLVRPADRHMVSFALPLCAVNEVALQVLAAAAARRGLAAAAAGTIGPRRDPVRTVVYVPLISFNSSSGTRCLAVAELGCRTDRRARRTPPWRASELIWRPPPILPSA